MWLEPLEENKILEQIKTYLKKLAQFNKLRLKYGFAVTVYSYAGSCKQTIGTYTVKMAFQYESSLSLRLLHCIILYNSIPATYFAIYH